MNVDGTLVVDLDVSDGSKRHPIGQRPRPRPIVRSWAGRFSSRSAVVFRSRST